MVDNVNLSITNLNSNLGKINAWANQRKMSFNPDPNKHAKEVIFCFFSLTLWRKYCSKITWVYTSMADWTFLKTCKTYLKKTKKKKTGLLRKPRNNILRAPLVTIYKSLIRPYLHSQDILYGQTFNIFFHEKLETI